MPGFMNQFKKKYLVMTTILDIHLILLRIGDDSKLLIGSNYSLCMSVYISPGSQLVLRTMI